MQGNIELQQGQSYRSTIQNDAKVLGDISVEEQEAGKGQEVREVERFVWMLSVFRVEFLLVNAHAGGDEEGDS